VYGALVVAARFDPPDARRQFEEWRARHQAILTAAEPDQIVIDVGRATGGDFVRVWLPPDLAARCGVEGRS
jgi:hypothetical protein